jgi:hypothetical protein
MNKRQTLQDGVNTKTNPLYASLVLDDGDGETFYGIDAQNPIPTSDDQVFALDIDQERSTSTGWTGGEVIDLFNDQYSQLVNSSSTTNPKILYIELKRPLQTNALGIATDQGNFSNTKITAIAGLGTDQFESVLLDESSDNTKKTFIVPEFPPAIILILKIEFYTNDTVYLSSIAITKASQRIVRVQAVNDKGTVEDISATNQGNLKVALQEYGDTPSIDAFARLRMSAPFTIFDSKQLHDKQPLFWDEELGGSATSTHSSINSETALTVTNGSSDYVIRQTKQRFNYQPGKSQLIFMTFQSPQISGVTSRIGLFDNASSDTLVPNNGIFFECDGTVSWNICKNGSITETATQANWNVDKLDGTGDSELTLDLTATQIMIIDFEWLGVGRVRAGFVIDGIIYYVHYFNHANDNTFSTVYMSTPNLPLRYTIQTDGTNGSTLKHICSSVISEGGIEKTGVLRGVDTGGTLITTLNTGNSYAILGIRLKTTHLDITVFPEDLSVICATNDIFLWSLQLNPTIAGTFTYGDVTNSSIQYATGANTNTITTPGEVFASGFTTQKATSDINLKTALNIGSKIDGTRDELVLVITPISANLSAGGALTIRELL